MVFYRLALPFFDESFFYWVVRTPVQAAAAEAEAASWQPAGRRSSLYFNFSKWIGPRLFPKKEFPFWMGDVHSIRTRS